MLKAYKSILKKRGISYSEDIVVLLEKERRYEDMCLFFKEQSENIDCLLVEAGIYPFIMEAAYINSTFPQVPIAIVGSYSKMVHCNSSKLKQFGPSLSTFQVALDVLYDQFQSPEKRKYNENHIKIESNIIDASI